MDLFKLDPGLTVWTWIAFAILCFVLAKWGIPPLLRNLETRERVIADSVDNAALLEKRLADLEQERTALLEQTRVQAEAVLRQAREDAEIVKKALFEKAAQEAAAIVAQGRARAAEERKQSIDALRQELADFIVECTETVVGSTLVGDKEREWSRRQVSTL